jgi:hypothetical protein
LKNFRVCISNNHTAKGIPNILQISNYDYAIDTKHTQKDGFSQCETNLLSCCDAIRCGIMTPMLRSLYSTLCNFIENSFALEQVNSILRQIVIEERVYQISRSYSLAFLKRQMDITSDEIDFTLHVGSNQFGEQYDGFYLGERVQIIKIALVGTMITKFALGVNRLRYD